MRRMVRAASRVLQTRSKDQETEAAKAQCWTCPRPPGACGARWLLCHARQPLQGQEEDSCGRPSRGLVPRCAGITPGRPF